jgi:uncharacterized protein (TIGR02266 family)
MSTGGNISGMSTDERRRHERTPLSMLVQFRFDSFDDFLAEYSFNISPGGIFIRTAEPREQGAFIYLQFSLRNGSRLIEGLGRVVRVNAIGTAELPMGMGVEFVNFDAESMALINDICVARVARKA